jgi:FixJ family two-component response regulator
MSKNRPLIAVVDDEASVRVALQRLIRAAGLSVKTFPSGIEVLEFMQSQRPDCIVLDLHMPDVNGFEVQRRMGECDMHVPVVVITGHDTPESNARALAAGACAYLLKPVDDQMLLDAIAAAIETGPGHSRAPPA